MMPGHGNRLIAVRAPLGNCGCAAGSTVGVLRPRVGRCSAWSTPPSRTGRASAPRFGKRKDIPMTTGTIKKIVADRGFGFITAEDGKEYFFHHESCRPRSSSTAWSAASGSRSRSRRPPRDPARTRSARPDGASPSSPVRRRSLRAGSAAPSSGTRSAGDRQLEGSSRSAHCVRLHLRAAPMRHRHVHPRPRGGRGTPPGHRPASALRAGSYPTEVRQRIRRDVRSDYLGAARALNSSSVEHRLGAARVGIWAARTGHTCSISSVSSSCRS